MCGISGIWSRQSAKPISEQMLARFNDALTHRGPDGSGVRLFGSNLGIAHRRLSILDVSDCGAQPMVDSSGRYHISFNGEVFNFIELRKELEALGEQFQSDSDTEVILAAYRLWGLEGFHRFNGMWAIAIWDQEKEELLLCRDRFGIKPLYYLDTDNLFAFASETQAFKHLDGFQREVHAQRMQIALADTYALEGRGYTIYKDIYQLLPGHLIRLGKSGRPRQERWYHIADRKTKVPATYTEQVHQFRDLFSDACALRMRSDVSLATALSGGVDSSAVYGMVHKLMQDSSAERVPEDWQRAFVAVFPGTVQDERPFAEAAVAHTGGRAEYIDPAQGDLLQDLLTTTRDLDTITGTPILALMSVYRGMRQHGVTVSLDGHGVDEMLYGYRKMVYDALEYHKWHGERKLAESTAAVLVELYAPELRVAKQKSIQQGIEQAFQMRARPLSRVKRWLKPLSTQPQEIGFQDLLPSLSDKPYDFSSMGAFDAMVHDEFFLRTLPSLLRNFDKAAMMSSIEIRMPFMDYRLVEYAFDLPYEAKLGGGFTKRVLRDAMVGIMPEANRVRTFKVGLAAPTMEWFQGPLDEYVKDLTHSQDFLQNPYWNASKAQEIAQRATSANWTVSTAAEAWKYINAQIILHEG